MITKARIRNFQSLRDITISLDRHTNVLVGESDVGKSAVIRAFRMVLENQAPSDDFISFGAKEAIVELWFTSGDKITRIKGPTGKANVYELLRKGEKKPFKFESFGKEIPKQIQEVIGFAPLDIGGAKAYSINFHKQTDPPFLLGEIGSVKAKFIGQLSDLLLMDQVITDINSDIRTAGSNVKYSTNEKARLKRSLNKFKTLPELEDLLGQLKDQSFNVGTLNERKSSLEILSRQRSNLIERRDFLSEEMDRLSVSDQIDIESLKEKYDYITALKKLYKEIKQTVSRRDVLEKRVKTQSTLIKQLANSELDILEKQEYFNSLVSISDLLEGNNESKELSEKAIEESNKALVECSKKMNEILKELPESCPTCGTSIGEKQKKFISKGKA